MANKEVAAAVGGRPKILTAGWPLLSRSCDSCKSSASVLFCRVESAFLCLACDAQIHTPGSAHARVRICEVCEQAPAAVTCKADAAALCCACDADIHSANPLARRHERVPVVPFHETPSAVRSSSNPIIESCEDPIQACGEEEAEAASWLLPDPNPNTKAADVGSREYCFSYPYADLNYPCLNDSVVPVQTNSKGFQEQQQEHVFVPSSAEKCVVELDFRRSKATYSYSAAADPSLSQSASSSSMEVGVVPDGNVMTETSNPYDSTLKASSVAVSALDREARVLRYREKRKNRKFEKTIRYASRKAYAETRPRIKGRFTKRAEIDGDVDRLYFPAAAALVLDSGYGVVPSF